MYRAIPKTESSYTFNFTDEERNVLRTNTLSASRKLYFYVRTKFGTNKFHDKKEVTFSVVENDDSKPSVTMTATLDNGSLPSKFDGLCIQGKSKYDVTLSAEGKYGATITNLYATVDGKTYNSASFKTDVIQSSGNVDVIGYAKDSREFTGSAKDIVNVLPYFKPLVIPLGSENAIQCYRSDGNGKRVGNSTSVWVKAKRSFYSVEGKNLCALEWRKKLVTEEWNTSHSWKDLLLKEASTDEYNALIPNAVFDLKESYTVQIRAIDDIGEYDIKTFEIPTQDVALHLGAGGKNVSIGTYCDYSKEHTFYSDWDAYFDKDVYVGGDRIDDFIVEQGQSGIWTYRKWKSGKAECWGKQTISTTIDRVTNDVLYFGRNLFEPIDYPADLFVDAPVEIVTYSAPDSHAGWVYTRGSNSATQTGKYNIMRWSSVTTTADLTLNYYTVGRLKQYEGG